MFKVNNKDIRTMSINNVVLVPLLLALNQISHLFLVFLIFDFKQVNAWDLPFLSCLKGKDNTLLYFFWKNMQFFLTDSKGFNWFTQWICDQIKNKLNWLQNMRNWPYQLDSIFCLTLTKYTFSLSSVFTKMFIKYRTGEENVWSSLPGSSTWMGSGKNDDI